MYLKSKVTSFSAIKNWNLKHCKRLLYGSKDHLSKCIYYLVIQENGIGVYCFVCFKENVQNNFYKNKRKAGHKATLYEIYQT